MHTGTYVVNTSAGDITVLKEQSELGTLAHGEATSARATAEASDAGRLAQNARTKRVLSNGTAVCHPKPADDLLQE